MVDKEKLLNGWSEICKSHYIDSSLYKEYNVLRGLRDLNGKGVLAGLTQISDVRATKIDENGEKVPCDGTLRYRGVSINELTGALKEGKRFGFEETAYLLLFGKLPNTKQLESFVSLLAEYRELPEFFISDVIIRTPCKDMMNTLQRGVLSLYNYDNNADSIAIENVLRQSLNLIAKFPLLAVYGYQSYSHHFQGKSLIIHTPKPELSTAENLLRLLRPNAEYTPLEANVLDICLMLHAEHGGGNNSTFTNHVVSSSHTDTYSAMTASLCSLKGPRHGGANIKVVRMFDDMKANIKDVTNEHQVEKYVSNLLDKKAFDKSGLVYGVGHAVYSSSDPRAEVLKGFAKSLSDEKGLQEDYALYENVAKVTPQLIAEKRKMYKGVSPNVDFYSGLVYKMLNIPYELYTPLFAVARIVGWSAHRMEGLINDSKIIRPAYKNVGEFQDYIELSKRK